MCSRNNVEIAACASDVVLRDSLVMVNRVQFEKNVEVSFASEMNNLRQVNAEHGSFIEVILGKDAEL